MTPNEQFDLIEKAHEKAMAALAADVHPYSGNAIREWEAQLDAAVASLKETINAQTEALREIADYEVSRGAFYEDGGVTIQVVINLRDIARAALSEEEK